MMPASPSLCLPDREKSCFACCPPIRPAGYEHVQHERTLRRLLRESTAEFSARSERPRPITGYSCWALGFLDPDQKLVGCLLHPGCNGGADKRGRVGYGEKCRRESCPQARVFAELSVAGRRRWLQLTEGLDTFAYSSRRFNPLFDLLDWGPAVMGALARHAEDRPLEREAFYASYPFFSAGLKPRACAYLLESLIAREGDGILTAPGLGESLTAWAGRFRRRIREIAAPAAGAPYTHTLPLEPRFLDFLRLGAGLARVSEGKARRLKERVDRELLLAGRP